MVYLALEVFNQFRIQKAAGHLAEGKHAEALEAVNGWRIGLVRSGTARRIRNEATYHLSLVELKNAVLERNWYVAHKKLAVTLESGKEVDSYVIDIKNAIAWWRGALNRMHDNGDFAKFRNALDLLNRVEFTTPGNRDLVAIFSHDVTVKLVRGFAEHQAWTESLKEIDILREHPKSTSEEVETLTSGVHERMVSTMNKALQANEYDRAEAIARMLEYVLPGSIDAEELSERSEVFETARRRRRGSEKRPFRHGIGVVR